MYAQIEETTIKLHTAPGGCVWYAKNISPPINSGTSVEKFLLNPVISGMSSTVRILGTPQNSELISALYLRRYKGEIRAIEVAGPNILNSCADLDDPRVALLQMRQVGLSPACGGWHPVTMLDYPTYAMIARFRRPGYVFDEAAETYLNLHPAYKALSLIPTIDAKELAHLLTTIIDPRWYVDKRMPERAAKLELFLGLTPQIQKRVSNGDLAPSRNREARCACVLAAWKSKHAGAVDLNNPANFLYRIHHNVGGGSKGDLRASQAFVRYLRYNWLAGLEMRNGPKDGLFAPNLFFKTPAEIETYAEHMAAQKSE
jgi:hypothetical protein